MNKEKYWGIKQWRNVLKAYLGNVIAFFIVLLAGSSIAEEINKQLPPELKINFKKIFLEALLFSLIIGGLT